MTSFECSISCNVQGCQETVSAPPYELPEDARLATEVKARRLGWVINHIDGDAFHICYRHTQASFHNNDKLK